MVMCIARRIGERYWIQWWHTIRVETFHAVFGLTPPADAAFANPELYEYLEAEGFEYAIRLQGNDALQ